jgi:hypothetical protein
MCAFTVGMARENGYGHSREKNTYLFCKEQEEERHHQMNRRIIGSVVMAAAFALVLLGASMLFSTGSTQASAPPNSPGFAAQSEKNVAQAKETALAGPAGTWQDIAPFPSVSIPPTPGSIPLRLKRGNATAYFPNGKLYVLGGRAGTDGDDTTLRNIFEYTPGEPGTWVQKAALMDESPVGSRWTANMAVATLTDTQGVNIYAIGGTSIDGVPTDRVRVYNPIADTVTNLTSDPWPASPVRNPGAWAVWNNKLYIYGGFSALGSGAVYAETWVFDPLGAPGSKWQRLTSADLPVARGFMGGVQLDGYIYAIGGDTWNAGTRQLVPSDLVHRMNPSQPSPTWTAVANLPTARGDLGAWAYDTGTNYEISGRIAVAGGVFPVPDAQGYLYNPGTNSWGAFPNMVHPTRNFGYAQLNGYLYAFGGYDYSNGLPQGANFNQRYNATQPIGSPTPTITGTLPTSTRTSTTAPPTGTSAGTNTPSRTPTVDPCQLNNYVITTATGTIVPGTVDTGNHGDDVVTAITLPFPFKLYGVTYTTANVSSNGNMQFVTSDTEYLNVCLPEPTFGPTIFGYWDDLHTGTDRTCSPGPCGIYTSVSGTAPNRILNVEWRTAYFSGAGSANFEIRLYEANVNTDQRFDIVYGTLTQNSTGTGGVQNQGGTRFTQDFCNTPVPAGRLAIYTLPPCGSPGATGTAVATGTSTRTATAGGTVCPPSGTSTPLVVNGSITTTDPDQTGRLFRDGIPDTCQAPGTCGAPIAGTFNHDTYTYQNSSNATVCITVDVNTACTGTNFIYVGAYLNSFNPAAICQNWVADVGSSPNPTGTFSFNVPANTTFVINVHEVTANAGCPAYTLTITGIPGGGGGCPTPGTSTAVSTVTATRTNTIPVSTSTATTGVPSTTPIMPTSTAVSTSTSVPATSTRTSTAVATVTSCPIMFTDVPPTDPFYANIRCLACRGIVSGYNDGTFRPYNNITRGQIAKIVANAAGFNEPITGQTYEDVLPTNTFYVFIERLTRRGHMGGYPCGQRTTEPCIQPENRPYFRPVEDATRGQLSKIVSNAAGYNDPVSGVFYADVDESNPFYVEIMRLTNRGVMSGYPCGSPGEPCDPQNRPYFRWGNPVTRGQASKIVANTFYPNCQTP